jgi:hypothetical protein
MDAWYKLQKQNVDEKVDQTEICGFATQALCDALVLEKLVKTLGNESKCPEPCNFDQFEWTLNVGKFPPTKDYWELMLKDEVIIENEANRTFEFAKENFVRIHIFYPDIKVTEKQQEKAYEVYNFIAEFSGTVDMLICFSFFTVFQVLELIMVWVCYKVIKFKKITESPESNMEQGKERVIDLNEWIGNGEELKEELVEIVGAIDGMEETDVAENGTFKVDIESAGDQTTRAFSVK